MLKQGEPALTGEENIVDNDQAMNVLYDTLDINDFNHIKNLKIAHEI